MRKPPSGNIGRIGRGICLVMDGISTALSYAATWHSAPVISARTPAS
jgi:hypothetical protein